MVHRNKLAPWFVTGITDAEGCFGLYIYKSTTHKTGWVARLIFQISLHEKDKDLLKLIQNYFCVGGITKHGPASLSYSVRSYKDMQIIIDHFDRFPLITNKLNDYILFKLAYDLFIKKEQLSIEGIEKLLTIKISMNLGLSPELKATFPHIKPYQECSATLPLPYGAIGIGRAGGETEEKYGSVQSTHLAEQGAVAEEPRTQIKKIPDPYWVAGFSSGEGCFIVDISKCKSTKIGYSVNLRVMISQHARDELLMWSLINYFNCGKLHKNNNCFNLTIRNFSDLDTKIIPFFIKYPIVGQKLLDFQDFCRVAKLMKEKEHLTIELKDLKK